MTNVKQIFPTTMQAVVVNKPEDKRITVIDTGKGSGKSVALLFKALQSDCTTSTIIHPNYKITKVSFDQAYKFLRPLGFRASMTSMILSHDKFNKKIKFCSDQWEKSAGISRDLIMFDNPEYCDIKTLIHHRFRAKELVFATDGLSEGFINYTAHPEDSWKNDGIRYIVDYENSHWSTLIVQDKYLTCKSNGDKVRIRESMFREDVYLVKGDGFRDNPYLSAECKRILGRENE